MFHTAPHQRPKVYTIQLTLIEGRMGFKAIWTESSAKC